MLSKRGAAVTPIAAKRARPSASLSRSPPPPRDASAASPALPRRLAAEFPGEHVPLFSLGGAGDAALLECTLLRRPSARNKSPYVADVFVVSENREAICHVPSMELGGKCCAGATVLVKRAVVKKGGPLVGSEATSAKYGTPKCEFICQLARLSSGGWVGAHPALGEAAAAALLETAAVRQDFGAVGDCGIDREVKRPCGADMRADFVLSPQGAARCVVEVKTVVDASSDAPPAEKAPKTKAALAKAAAAKAALAAAPAAPSSLPRAGTFPWGRTAQKGPDGEKVVSARAIKHVDNLAAISRGELLDDGDRSATAGILFVVVRGDVEAFRPNVEACPSFSRHLLEARSSGVQIHARRIQWAVSEDFKSADAIDDGALPVEL
ncbi:hypothetical protein M885DRAFT_512797 [Pelagophyceae sp. CCMP2097]|nr:hypothetical protein M885DRAFT_512797 [Pelagophyceae sp. CCMP2097]